jgi:uncharacterized protein (TIGR02996 family)
MRAPHHPDLHQAILDDPDADAPRLVYADWLEEHGDPDRADFIRLQIGLTRPDLDLGRRLLSYRRTEQLRDRHEAAWLADLPVWATPHEFRRGFLSKVGCRPAAWVEQADELLRVAPVDTVEFEYAAEAIPALAGCPSLQRIRTLLLTDYFVEESGRPPIDDGRFELLVRSPHLENLRGLSLAFLATTGRAMEVLADCAHLGRLEDLNLWQADIGAGGLDALARSPHLPRLAHLDLSHVGMGTTGLDVLARSGRRLRRLRLNGMQLPTRGLEQLAASSTLGGLEELSIKQSEMEVSAVEALASSPRTDNLRTLTLPGGPNDDARLRSLVRSPHLRNLRSLSLQGGVRPPAVGKLLASDLLARLRSLDLISHRKGAVSLEPLLARTDRLPLEALNWCGLPVDRLVQLVAAPALAGLVSLSAPWTDADDAAIDQILDHNRLPGLRHFCVGTTRAGEPARQPLADRWGAPTFLPERFDRLRTATVRQYDVC